MHELGFDKYVDQLKDFMKNYNAAKEDEAKKTQFKKRKLDEEDTHGQENIKRLKEGDDSESECQVIDLTKH